MSTDSTTTVVRAQGVHKSFGPVHVLRGVDLTVSRGEVVVLLGPSGGGKSTFLRTLNHLEPIDAGTIEVLGERIGHRDRDGRRTPPREKQVSHQRRAIGMVFQQFNLFPSMTATGNVACGPIYVRGTDKTAARAHARELLGMVGLADKVESYPFELSGGQQQRVAIARALAMRPQVMLFDEPTSALDPEMVKEVLEVIVRLRESGMTMIIVSHEMSFARAAADRAVLISDGVIIEDRPPAEFFAAPQSERARQFRGKIL